MQEPTTLQPPQQVHSDGDDDNEALSSIKNRLKVREDARSHRSHASTRSASTRYTDSTDKSIPVSVHTELQTMEKMFDIYSQKLYCSGLLFRLDLGLGLPSNWTKWYFELQGRELKMWPSDGSDLSSELLRLNDEPSVRQEIDPDASLIESLRKINPDVLEISEFCFKFDFKLDQSAPAPYHVNVLLQKGGSYSMNLAFPSLVHANKFLSGVALSAFESAKIQQFATLRLMAREENRHCWTEHGVLPNQTKKCKDRIQFDSRMHVKLSFEAKFQEFRVLVSSELDDPLRNKGTIVSKILKTKKKSKRNKERGQIIIYAIDKDEDGEESFRPIYKARSVRYVYGVWKALEQFSSSSEACTAKVEASFTNFESIEQTQNDQPKSMPSKELISVNSKENLLPASDLMLENAVFIAKDTKEMLSFVVAVLAAFNLESAIKDRERSLVHGEIGLDEQTVSDTASIASKATERTVGSHNDWGKLFLNTSEVAPILTCSCSHSTFDEILFLKKKWKEDIVIWNARMKAWQKLQSEFAVREVLYRSTSNSTADFQSLEAYGLLQGAFQFKENILEYMLKVFLSFTDLPLKKGDKLAEYAEQNNSSSMPAPGSTVKSTTSTQFSEFLLGSKNFHLPLITPHLIFSTKYGYPVPDSFSANMEELDDILTDTSMLAAAMSKTKTPIEGPLVGIVKTKAAQDKETFGKGLVYAIHNKPKRAINVEQILKEQSKNGELRSTSDGSVISQSPQPTTVQKRGVSVSVSAGTGLSFDVAEPINSNNPDRVPELFEPYLLPAGTIPNCPYPVMVVPADSRQLSMFRAYKKNNEAARKVTNQILKRFSSSSAANSSSSALSERDASGSSDSDEDKIVRHAVLSKRIPMKNASNDKVYLNYQHPQLHPSASVDSDTEDETERVVRERKSKRRVGQLNGSGN